MTVESFLAPQTPEEKKQKAQIDACFAMTNPPPVFMVDEAGLIGMWACMSQDPNFKLRERNKRLVMFAPDGTKYKTLKSQLNRSVFEPVSMADGLGDIYFEDIIKIIAASASNA